MEGKADLHMHSTYSDGAYPPQELVGRMKAAGVGVVSLTDHDSVGGIEEAAAAGKDSGVEVIPGIELSATLDRREVHILGYFIDYHNEKFLEALVLFREYRLKRAERIVSKLNSMNIPLSLDSVLEQAGEGAVGRVHIANAMVNDGHADTFNQVFNKYIGEGRPAFERKFEMTPQQTVTLIAEAGGISVLAHPGRSIDEKQLLQIIDGGIDGIEVVHPSHSPDLVEHYRKIVNEYFLVESGGSDYHGGLRDDDHVLGRVNVPFETVETMRQRVFPRSSHDGPGRIPTKNPHAEHH